MRKLTIFCFLIGVLGCGDDGGDAPKAPEGNGGGGQAEPSAPTWATFESADLDFSVEFPGEPKQSEGSWVGKVHEFQVKGKDGLMFFVAVSVSSLDVKKYMNGTSVLPTGYDGQTLVMRGAEVGRHRGVELAIERSETTCYRYRAFDTPGKFYLVVCAGETNAVLQGEDAARFFGSFRVTR